MDYLVNLLIRKYFVIKEENVFLFIIINENYFSFFLYDDIVI